VIEAEQKLQTSTVLKLETEPEIQDRPRGSRGITRFALSHLRSTRTGSHLRNRIWMPSIPRVRLPNRSRRQGLIAIATYEASGTLVAHPAGAGARFVRSCWFPLANHRTKAWLQKQGYMY
jgi:hypothetical protein